MANGKNIKINGAMLGFEPEDFIQEAYLAAMKALDVVERKGQPELFERCFGVTYKFGISHILTDPSLLAISQSSHEKVTKPETDNHNLHQSSKEMEEALCVMAPREKRVWERMMGVHVPHQRISIAMEPRPGSGNQGQVPLARGEGVERGRTGSHFGWCAKPHGSAVSDEKAGETALPNRAGRTGYAVAFLSPLYFFLFQIDIIVPSCS